MSFTSRKPWVVTADDVKNFSRVVRRADLTKETRTGLYCGLCGHAFAVGQTARWVYANFTGGPPGGNFFVCEACDGPDHTDAQPLEKRRSLHAVFDWLHGLFSYNRHCPRGD